MSYNPIAIKQNGVVVGYATKSMDITGDQVSFTHDGQGHFVFKIDTSSFVSKLGAEFTGDLVLRGGNIIVTENETIDGRHVAADGLVLDAINSGTGLIARTASGTFEQRAITGTDKQVTITNGSGIAGNPVVSLPDYVQFPGSVGFRIPSGTTAQRPVDPVTGTFRYNSELGSSESFNGIDWIQTLNEADKRFRDTTVLTVKKDPGKNEFATISDALAYLENSPIVLGPDNLIVVKVSAGVYVEPETVVVPAYVHIVGAAQGAVTIVPATATQHIFQLTGRCSLNNMTINNAGEGYAAIQVADINDWALIHKIETNDSYYGIQMQSINGTSALYIEMTAINGGHIGLNTRTDPFAEVEKRIFVNADNFYVFPGEDSAQQFGIFASGTNTVINMRGFALYGYGEGDTGVGMLAQNGASISMSNGAVLDWNIGVCLNNVGSAPHGTLVGVEFKTNISRDLHITHPGATGSMFGMADRSKVLADGVEGFTITYSDNEAGGFVTIGDLFLGRTAESLTNVTDLITETSPMGLISGGEVIAAGGTAVTVQPGIGYVRDVNGDVKRVEFEGGTVTLTPGAAPHVYVDSSGVVRTAQSEPSTLTNIVLARVLVGATTVMIIGEIPFRTSSFGNTVETYLRSTVGPVFVSGSIISENTTTPRALNITAGEYWYGTIKRTPIEKIVPTILNGYLANNAVAIAPITQIPNDTINETNAGLRAMTAGYFAKHSIFLTGSGAQTTVLMAHARTEYATLEEAIEAPLAKPVVDPGSTPIIGAVIVQQGVNSLVKIIDLRPRHFTSGVIQGGGAGSAVDHGDLLGLSDDDHLQYLNVNGVRAMTGALNLGTNPITNVTTINGINLGLHGSRHLPNGSDPIATAAPSGSLSAISTNTEGIANSFARSDHTHSVAGLQASSNELTGLSNISGTGVVSRTSAGVYTASPLSVNLTTQATGNLSVTHLDSGTNASLNTFFRGDGTWAVTDGVKSIDVVSTTPGLITSGGPVTTSGSIQISLSDDLVSIESLSGVGYAVRTAANTWAQRQILGQANQIVIASPAGTSGNTVISLANNPILPGTGSVTLPMGTTAQRPATPTVGSFRYNSDTKRVEFWNEVMASWDNAPRLAGDAFTGNISVAGTITAKGSANNLVVSGSATGGNVTADLTGTDANISFNFNAKGTGTVQVNNSPVWTAATLNKVSQLTNDSGYITVAQPQTITGDVAGTGTVNNIALTLANTGVTAGTYRGFTVDAKGRITSVAAVTTLVGYGITDAVNTSQLSSAATANAVVQRDASGNFAANTITAALTGNASTATKLQTARTLSLTGDGTASMSFDGSANATSALTLANSGVTAGTYRGITVDAKGRITSIVPVTTVAGYGITDAITTANIGSQSVASAAKLTTARTVAFTGDVTGSTTFDGTANTSTVMSLSPTGVAAGTYTTVTVDAAGRVLAGSQNGGIVALYRGTTAPMSGTSQIQPGNTPPSSTAGTLLFTKTITPTATTSDMMLNYTCLVDMSYAGADITIAMFRGTTCIGVALTESNKFSSQPTTVTLSVLDRPATLSPVTYTVRIGVTTGTWYMGQTAVATFGGINRNVWSIMEIN
jgi:hypothetical protein